MKEHEDCDMTSIEKSSVIVDSTSVEEIVTREGKTDGRDEGEDMMVDVVGADVVDLDSKVDSVGLVEECMQKETEPRNMNMDVEEAAVVTGEDVCHDSVGSRVLGFEKVEVTVVEEGSKRSGEVSGEILQGNVVTACGSLLRDCKESSVGGGDIAVIDSKGLNERGSTEAVVEQHVESVEEVGDGDCEMDIKTKKEAEILDTAVIDSKDLTEKGSTKEVVEHHLESVEEVADGDRELDIKTKKEAEILDIAVIDIKDITEKGSSEEVVEQHVESVEEVSNGDHEMDIKTKKEAEILDIAGIDSKDLTETGSTEEVVEQHVESVEGVADGDCEMDIETKKEAGSLEIAVIDSKDLTARGSTEGVVEQHVESVEKVADGNREMDIQTKKKAEILDIAVIDNKDLTERGSTEEVVGQHVESVEEVADGDRVVDKKTKQEAEILDSSKIAESSTTTANLCSQEVDMIVVEDIASKDEAEDSVSMDPSLVRANNQNSSVQDSASVDPSLVSANNQNSSAELVNAGTDEVAGRSKEESLHPTIEVRTEDSQGTTSREPRFVGGENDLIDREEESDKGLPKEIMEQPMECDQQVGDGDCVVDQKIGKQSEALDSSKISEPSTTTNPSSEDVDVVVVDEGLASKDEAQDGVSVDPSLVCADNRSSSTKVANSATGEGDAIVQAEYLDQQAEADELSKKQSFHPTTEVIANYAQNPENGTVVGDSKSAVELSSGEPQFVGETALIDREEAEKGLTVDEEIVGQHPESVQEVINGDGVMDEKTGKGDEVLDSSKIPEILTTGNLGPEEVLTSKIEAQDSDSIGPRLICPDNQSISTENSDQRAEVDTMSKDESMHPTIEITTCTEVDEVTTASEVQVTSAGGMASLVENQRLEVNAVLDSSRPDVAACTEPEPSIDQMTPATANKVIKIESEGQDCMVYVEDQGLKAGDVSRCSIVDGAVCAKPSNEVPTMNGFQVSADAFEEVNAVTPGADVGKHCVVHEGSEFSYEDAHLERGEDAGMDIDEVLGWKDEMPGIDVLNGDPEKDQHYKINADPEGGNITNLVSFKKRKALDSISDGLEKRPSLQPEKVPTALISTPRPSFKVGECIQRVASQLSGPPSVLKSNSDPNGQDVDQLVGPENSQMEMAIVECKQSSVAEMLSQLLLVAQDPMNGYSFLNTIKPFFYDHRAVGRPVSSRKRNPSNENKPEEFEFDDVNDSYWTDRIIQNHSEEQLLQENQNGGQEHNVVAYEPDKLAKPNRRSNKKRFMFSNHEMGLKEQSELVERRRQNLATEVVLKFPEGIYFPSEIHLNKMFRRFGALMESETEVDRQNGRARVVFKKCSDAEVAHSSAGKFNIFGPINVNYELNYTPLVSYKPLPLPLLQDSMDAS